MKNIVAFLVLALAFGASPILALDAPVDEQLAKLADNESYTVKAPGMVLHGLYEIGEAPLEPLHQPYDKTISKGDHVFGLFKGINDGTYNVLAGFTRGIFNIVRSFVPGMGRYEDKQHQKKMLPGLAS